jgi:hypothetical protein
MYICVVCGFDRLEYPQRDEFGYATQCICPCCGFQSGFHDDAIHEPMTIEEYRKLWIDDGAKWWSNNRQKPENWSAEKQLEKINIK